MELNEAQQIYRLNIGSLFSFIQINGPELDAILLQLWRQFQDLSTISHPKTQRLQLKYLRFARPL
jgi:hypothetical protein